MKRTSVILLLSCLTILTAGTAQATRWDGFSASATCEGWQVDGAAKVGSANQPYVEIPYTITLSRDDQVIEEFTGSVRAYFQMNADEFSLSGVWSGELQGSYDVAGVFTLPFTTSGDSVMAFAEVLDCGTPQTSCEPHKPRWWVRHPDQWPVSELDIGGVVHSHDQLVRKMNRCTRHRVSVRLLRHLVAAKLNVVNGCDNVVADEIEAGDAFFAANGLNPCLRRSERREARRLKRVLQRFNRGESSGDKTLAEVDDDMVDFDHETVNMSDLKEIFR